MAIAGAALQYFRAIVMQICVPYPVVPAAVAATSQCIAAAADAKPHQSWAQPAWLGQPRGPSTCCGLLGMTFDAGRPLLQGYTASLMLPSRPALEIGIDAGADASTLHRC